MDGQVQGAFENWKSGTSSHHIKLLPGSIQLKHDSADPNSFSVRAQYELPDGGRFHLIISGTNDSASPSLTPMVEDDLGLPDGFLMDINNFLFSDLADSPNANVPEYLVDRILEHASHLYDKLTNDARPSSAPAVSPQAPILDRRDVTPSTKRKRKAFTYSDPDFGESRLATTTLMKQLSILSTLDTKKDGYTARPLEDDLYIWTVRLYFLDYLSCQLATDIARLPDQDHVQLEFRFPSSYPNVPPIVRVVSPHIVGGHVAPHGGLCMELLTTSGWAPVNSIDVVCIQIRTLLLHGRARIDFSRLNAVRNYTFEGALNDMRNIVRIHRWDTPEGRSTTRRRVLKS